MSWGQQWAPYVSVGEKLIKAAKKAAALAKKQRREPAPVKIQGKAIAKTFWGKAWCDNLTAYQDYSNRLPRGATYVRNGSVVDLVIHPKKIEAIVAGSDPYTVKIEITALDSKRWKAIRSECSESIDSLLDLLSGKLSDGVMQRLTDQKTGLFPAPREIKMSCSCPDYSSCCKHLAAVMYGIGARLDSQPELLFLLRGVDHQDLVSQAIAAGNLDRELSNRGSGGLDSQDLGAIFGIELDSVASAVTKPTKKKRTPKKAAAEPVATAAVPKKSQPKSKSRTVTAKAAATKIAATKSAVRATSKSSGAKATAKSAKKKTAVVKTAARRSPKS
jgi:uncharacterized Zn finger protein